MRFKKLLPAILALLCLFACNSVLARKTRDKPLRDTLMLHLGGSNRVVVPVENIRNLGNVPGINAVVSKLNRDLSPDVLSEIDSRYATTVFYLEPAGGGRTIKVSNTATERLELSLNKETGKIIRRHNPDSVIVELEDKRTMLFILDSLGVLRTLEGRDLDALVPEAGREIASFLATRAKKDLFPYKGFYSATFNPEAEVAKRLGMSTHGAHHEQDYLRVNINMGAGLIRDKLVPEIGAEAAFVFGTRRFLGFNATMHYFFDRRENGSYGMAINTFLNVEYARSFNRGKLWQKFGAGYLVSRQGNYFGENTLKASLSLGTKKFEGLHLIPELFFTDNFRTIFPGLRVGIGF